MFRGLRKSFAKHKLSGGLIPPAVEQNLILWTGAAGLRAPAATADYGGRRVTWPAGR